MHTREGGGSVQKDQKKGERKKEKKRKKTLIKYVVLPQGGSVGETSTRMRGMAVDQRPAKGGGGGGGVCLLRPSTRE